VAPSGNQTATEKTNINLKRSEKPVYSPPAGQVGTEIPAEKKIFFFPWIRVRYNVVDEVD
jgi:hypothetical protein